MKRRHALRFENGERRGETVTLEAGDAQALSLGRRPGNGVVIQDPSVSGRHAEFVLDAEGVLVRDLGSTNGTKVGDERVSEQRLAHGDVLHFGNVRATFLDALIEADAGAPEPPAAAPRAVKARAKEPAPAAPSSAAPSSAPPTAADAADAGDDVHTVSASALARSKGSFSPGSLILLALLAVGGGAAWFYLRSDASPVGTGERAVVEVRGNLLTEGYSFEDEAPDGAAYEDTWPDRWSAAEAAPASFDLDGSARRSGAQGLSAVLASGEWAEHRSESVRAAPGSAFEATAWSRADGAWSAVGLRFESSQGSARAVTVWSPRTEVDDYEPLTVASATPPGYDRVSAVLQGRSLADAQTDAQADADEQDAASGWVEFDDVSLVPDGESKAPAMPKIGEYELSLVGASELFTLFKIDRALVTGLVVETAEGRAPFAREQDELGVRLSPTLSGAARLSFFAEPALVAGGVATVAPDGAYRTHQIEFSREGVSAVLLGAGRDLVRVGFSSPLTLRGVPSSGSSVSPGEAGAGFRFSAEVGPGADVHVQLAFQDERNQAATLARAARQAAEGGASGEAAALWTRLLDEYPYDADLLNEAVGARARLVEQGLALLREQALAVERADFFRLVDDYRACRAATDELARTYAGTEVAAGAEALTERIDARLDVLEAQLEQHERGRLEAIARTLRASESPLLAERVETYLAEQFGEPGQGPQRAIPQQEAR